MNSDVTNSITVGAERYCVISFYRARQALSNGMSHVQCGCFYRNLSSKNQNNYFTKLPELLIALTNSVSVARILSNLSKAVFYADSENTREIYSYGVVFRENIKV